ncbi:Mut7-C RNAse domain-containing protein [Georgenia halophila]|uniref:Mut7-C RNAse domain-containing protein n=1 Tax=Georgenia halophila TaxID=620889 RepID=A0ABP8L3K5_9MICO
MLTVGVEVGPELRFLLRPDRRDGHVEVAAADTDTVGHVVQMVGVPLTEVGALRVGGRTVGSDDPLRWYAGLEAEAEAEAEAAGAADRRPVIEVPARPRPQPVPTEPPRFLLDVHLGSLARRLRLVGVDAAYQTDAADETLVAQAVAEQRVLLTRDRGLLFRSALPHGALVRHDRAAEQLADVLDRFAPPLAPWTRCGRCNGVLVPVAQEEVANRLEPGTRRTYDEFARCSECRQVYWRGAHSGPLEQLVRRAEEIVARATRNTEGYRRNSGPRCSE